ncbi:MAG: hypothetical protein IPN90_04690 [Elusimicrobia bacterium]|nr:hypothetical protein [Elusimicrobiota bacterium]
MENASAVVRAARLFEFHTRFLWPLHRLWAKGKLSRRCRRCALSERATPLDKNQICAECLAPQKVTPLAPPNATETAALSKILADHEGGGQGRYDALILFSGGKDSVYMVRRLQTDHPKLRLLAFTIDNTFMSPIARANVLRLVDRLDLSHITFRPARATLKKLYRYGITHLNDGGGYGTVDFSDGEFILDSARALAAEKGIPLIVCGYSRYQVQDGLGLHSFESPPERERADRTHVAGLALSDIFTDSERGLWWRGSRWPTEKVARLLFPLYAWNLDESAIVRQVADWGLLHPRENSPLVTNHQLIPLLGVVDIHRMGYSGFEKEFCRMIREGKAPLKRWRAVFEFLEYTARTGMFVKPIILKALSDLDLTPDEVGVRFSS